MLVLFLLLQLSRENPVESQFRPGAFSVANVETYCRLLELFPDPAKFAARSQWSGVLARDQKPFLWVPEF